MAYNSIEAAAEDLGVSTRQCWRYLQQGRILKTQNSAGDTVFELNDTDTDNGTMTRHKGFSVSEIPKNNVIDSLKAELAASRLSLEIAKAEDARSAWQQRRDAEHRAEAEKAALIQAQKLRVEKEIEEKARNAELTAAKMQKLKAAILPEAVRDILPSEIFAEIFQEIAKIYDNDACKLSFPDLLILGKAARNRILSKKYATVSNAFSNYGRSLLIECLKEYEREIKDLAK